VPVADPSIFLADCCRILALSTAPPSTFDYFSQIGIVEFLPDASACLTIPNPSLKVGEAVKTIVLDKPQVLETA
jgi:hypothetical protein